MIDLAPGHKLGLTLANPVILAAGAIGYGEALPAGLDLGLLGAVVVGPILGSSRGGGGLPRLGETSGGVVLATGPHNRGVRDVVQRFAPLWPRLGCPVIAHLADAEPDVLAKTARRLNPADGLQGLEIAVPPAADVRLAVSLVRAAVHNSELPVSVKLPLDRAELLALAMIDAGVSWLVVGLPPRGAGLGFDPWSDTRQAVTGSVYGPLAFASMLMSLLAVGRLQLGAPLVACGGIHTLEQAAQALTAGAAALQVDSAVWVEPGLPQRLALAFAE